MNKGWMTFAVVAAAGLVHAAMQPIAGTNVVGFVEIAAPAAKNSIIAVPFEACLQAGVPGKLGDLVSTYGLTAHSSDPALADQLVVLTVDNGSPAYYYYYNDAEDGWTAITTEQIMPNGSKKTLTPPAASAFDVARGQGFWIKRAAGSGSTVYVQGQVSEAKQATSIGEGLNLISYAALESFDLNATKIQWTGAYGVNGISNTTDRIMVGNGDGTYKTYYYYVKKAGSSSYYDQFTNKWVESTSTGPALPTANVPAGQGFWYHRRGTGAFTFRPDGE